MIAIDNQFEYSFEVLKQNIGAIGTQDYAELLQRFKQLYEKFVGFWRQNEQNKDHFRLVQFYPERTVNRIEAALSRT